MRHEATADRPRLLPLLLGERGDNWPRLALAAWSILLLVLCTRSILKPASSSTFPGFANAAQKWVRGGNLYIYGPDEHFDTYRYSPAATVLLVPFGNLPLTAGTLLWRLCNVAVYVAALLWWCRSGVPQALTTQQRGLFFLLILPLSIGSLNNAQSNPLVIGCLLGAVTAAGGRRWLLASICIAIATAVKIYPLSLGLVLCVLWPRELIGRLALCLTAAFALPFLAQEPTYVIEQYRQWLAFLVHDDRHAWPLDHSYRDFWLLCRLWHLPVSTTGYLGLQLGAAAGVAILSWCGRHGPNVLTQALSLTLCWIMLFGPTTESCTYILLAPVLGWTCLRCWQPTSAWLPSVLTTVSFAFFLVAAMAAWFPFGARVHALGLQPLAVLVLSMVVVGFAIGDSRRRDVTSTERLQRAEPALV